MDGNWSFWKPAIVTFVLFMIVGGAGAVLTELGSWYRNLRKPSWQPPDWLFGPAWTTIFALTSLSAAFAWQHAQTPGDRQTIIGLLAINAFFNILWSVLFFRMRRPDWALIEAFPLWLSILAPIILFGRYSHTASWLLVPYLVWVTFAIRLNYKIIQLNPQT